MTQRDAGPLIRLRGVRHNNLKNLDLDLPTGRLIVVTGLSGSGKSSLAFDTLYAEGQRRYLETFSPYARQFFDRMDKPQVDRIEGIPPAIAIEQRNNVRTTRSTVGTMTELCDYLKALWPHLAQLHCRRCRQPVRAEPPQGVWQSVRSRQSVRSQAPGAEVRITFDLPLSEKLSLSDSLALVAKQGYRRLLLRGEAIPLEDAASRWGPQAGRLTSITIVQDQLRLLDVNRARFVEGCEQAYHFGKGKLAVQILPSPAPASPRQPVHPSTLHFSAGLHCAACDLDYREPSAALFSFNHPMGACPTCKGFGRIITIDYDLAIPDRSKTLAQGAVRPWQTGQGAECQRDLLKTCKQRQIPTDVPFHRLPEKWQDWVVQGDPDYGKDAAHRWPRAWYGVKGYFRWLESKAYKMHVRVLLSRYRAYRLCPDCQGQRFKPETLLYRVKVPTALRRKHGAFPLTPSLSLGERGKLSPSSDDSRRFGQHEALPTIPPPHEPESPLTPSLSPAVSGGEGVRRTGEGEVQSEGEDLSLADFYALPVDRSLALIESLAEAHALTPSDPMALVLGEVRSRLQYLVQVGLGYLTLDRPTRTLSGGETERVNLTACLGTRLVNTLFVLDEPSVGLHARDTARLVGILEKLRDLGNTVVVVEHEPAVMRAADHLIDLGPGRGQTGGEVVFQGPFHELLSSARSLTGQYLSGRRQIPLPQRRPVNVGQASSLSPPPGLPPAFERADPATGALALNEVAPPYRDRLEACPTLRIRNAARHNLKQLTVEIPLQRFVCLTGVSGSGKTTLVREVLLPALQAKLSVPAQAAKASERLDSDPEQNEAPRPSPLTPDSALEGSHHLQEVVLVDQSPLGKTPRSNPAVYVGAFDSIREIFAQTELARQRGLSASAFSFNSAQGRCDRCSGAGFEKVEMQFLSDVFIRCPDCQGRRYRAHILEVKLPGPAPQAGWSIADLLDMTVAEAVQFLLNYIHLPAARRALGRLKLLQEVGLGYLRLGQPINTLSGGESQRLKLVSHLAYSAAATDVDEIASRDQPVSGEARAGREDERQSRAASPGPAFSSVPAKRGGPSAATTTRRTLFLFDEPTTGLHFDDVRVLLEVFQRLVRAGHSLLVIEHNLEVIKCADWVIDLGPEAGQGGGQLVAHGTPEDIAGCEASHTGRFLRSLLASSAGSEEVREWGSERGTSTVLSLTSSPPHPFAPSHIEIHGAREHNLKNLSLSIPRDQFVVVTGVSGSGKSTLAFDLLFAEGQRRFLDSMNTYARQFVEQLSRPDVDRIAGIPPTVSIEQRTSRGGGKSTVATVTEVYHFLRLLFARLGTPYCPDCRLPVEAQTRDQLGRLLGLELKKRGDLLLLAPVVKNRKGFHSDVAEWAARHGYREVRADGKIYDTRKPFRLDRFKEHDVEIVVGVLDRSRGGTRKQKIRDGVEPVPPRQPLIDETLRLGQGTLLALDNHGRVTVHSTERACPQCRRSFPPLDPKMFSYNSAQGWCPTCRGFGELFYLPEDVDRGERADAIEETWWRWQEGEREVCPDCQGARLKPDARAVRLNVGQASSLSRKVAPREAGSSRGPLGPRPAAERKDACPTIVEISQLAVAGAYDFFRKLKFSGRAAAIARDILPEILERLKFLAEVGLGYLQLGRGVTTLSGGEGQRIRLAAQLGSNLSGVLYILDEPSIGLHARDNEQLLDALAKLRARGNSLVVVEHDEETMRRADRVIDLGPGAGRHGGSVVAAGTLQELQLHNDSITGQCLRAKKNFPARGQRRPVKVGQASSLSLGRKAVDAAKGRPRGERPLRSVQDRPEACPTLTVHNASANNLKNLTVDFPLGRLVLITGVSGSGKSTLVRECLLPALQTALRAKTRASASTPQPSKASTKCSGFGSLKAVYEVDQSPIGRTPRSTPATYVGFFDEIRALFAQTPEAKMRGYTSGRFSFNSRLGRCPECEGAGTIKLEMNFLPPAFVRCETCHGTRFNRETLDIEYRGRNVAQVLDLSVEDALEVFAPVPKIARPLRALRDTGLDYLKLGQTSPTLSGGEAQRVKLVTHLLAGLKDQLELFDPSDPKQRRNLFILEEPTIGLHMADVRRLVGVLQRLVDAGHSVFVIEHNLDLIAEADWVIDLGPEGGDAGGRIVVEGTPEQVAKHKRSHTGRFLRRLFQTSSRVEPLKG